MSVPKCSIFLHAKKYTTSTCCKLLSAFTEQQPQMSQQCDRYDTANATDTSLYSWFTCKIVTHVKQQQQFTVTSASISSEGFYLGRVRQRYFDEMGI